MGLQIPIFKLAYDNAEDLKSRVLGFPIFRVGYIYLGIQTVTSIVLVILGAVFDEFPVWISLIVCLLIVSCSIVCSIVVDIARDEIVQIEKTQTVDTQIIKVLRTRSANLACKTNASELRKKIENLAEEIKYSDPVSNSKIVEMEKMLLDCFTQLENAVINGEFEIALDLKCSFK